MPHESKRVLCLWLQNWPIQRLVVEHNELRCEHVVLFRQDSRRGQLVAAASPLALQGGVRIGMPLPEAKSLLRRGTQPRIPTVAAPGQTPRKPFHVVPHDPVADLNALEVLADSLERFSPIIGLESPACPSLKRFQPSSIFLDVTQLEHLFNGEDSLANEVAEHCFQRGYLVQVAIADTVGLAWGVARFGAECRAKPSQPFVVPTGDCQSMPPLPINALRLNPQISETLDQLGVVTIGQLLQLPRRDLSSRFGGEIHQRLDQMTGVVAEPIVARHRPPDFYAEQLLDFPTSDRETVEVILERLTRRICCELAAKQQGALEWTIRLFSQHKRPIKFCVRLFQPTATVDHVMQLAQMQLEQVLMPVRKRRASTDSRFQNVLPKTTSVTTKTTSPPTQPPNKKVPRKKRTIVRDLEGDQLAIREITVGVTSCVLLTQRQRQLFDENPRLDRQELAQLINRLTSRLGAEQVVYPTIRSGAQPEYAFQFKPLIHRNRRPRKRSFLAEHSHVMARPLQLYETPVRLQSNQESAVRAMSSAQAPQPPKSWVVEVGQGGAISAAHHRIIDCWGPERIETGWWRGPTTRRDYWRVEIETHQQFWIYCNLRNGQWFIHGEF